MAVVRAAAHRGLGPMRTAGMWEHPGSRGPGCSQPAPAALPFPGQLFKQILHYSGTALLSVWQRGCCLWPPSHCPALGTELWAFRKWLHFCQIFSHQISGGRMASPQARKGLCACLWSCPAQFMLSVYQLWFIYWTPKQSQSLMHHNHSAGVCKPLCGGGIVMGPSAERKFPPQCCSKISWILCYWYCSESGFRFPALHVLHVAHFSLPLGNKCFHKL